MVATEVGSACGLPVPASSDDPPLVRLFDRLSSAHQALAQTEQRVLLAIDEFEKIDEKIRDRVFSIDLLATVRDSIQTHRHVIWAFVGSHALDELEHARWSSYFVGLRTIEVTTFTLNESHQLLTEPLATSALWQRQERTAPRFDPAFWGDRGIERIHAEAGGWPHLLQLLAESAVDLLNRRELPQLTPELLEEVNEIAVNNGTVVFDCTAPGS